MMMVAGQCEAERRHAFSRYVREKRAIDGQTHRMHVQKGQELQVRVDCFNSLPEESQYPIILPNAETAT